jgi:hypothetical protein
MQIAGAVDRAHAAYAQHPLDEIAIREGRAGFELLIVGGSQLWFRDLVDLLSFQARLSLQESRQAALAGPAAYIIAINGRIGNSD